MTYEQDGRQPVGAETLRTAPAETPRKTLPVVPSPRAETPGEAHAPRRRPKHPGWVKVRYAANDRFRFVGSILRQKRLHTVCEEAECPNRGECWGHGTATFMLLGDTCTRGCSFCAVGRGKPLALDPSEPEHVAEVIESLRLDYAVLTSVDRDDLPDEGADHFASTVEAIHRRLPACRVEALVPDFHARRELIERVARSPLFVFAHNVETVPRLYRRVRPGSEYRRSLRVLSLAKECRPGILTKSSLMLGLGESRGEVLQVARDLRDEGVDVLTLGQYLRPSAEQVDVFRYVTPAEFDELRDETRALGFRNVFSGPLVRSSYHAWKVTEPPGGEAPGEGHPRPRRPARPRARGR